MHGEPEAKRLPRDGRGGGAWTGGAWEGEARRGGGDGEGAQEGEGEAPRISEPSAVRGMMQPALRVASWWQPVEAEQVLSAPTPVEEGCPPSGNIPPVKRRLDKGEVLEKEQTLWTAHVGTTAAAAVGAGTAVVPMGMLERRLGVEALLTTAEWASLREVRFQGSMPVREA